MAGSVSGAVGALCALGGAVTNAGSVIQTRRLTTTETTSSIVFYFSFICALAGLATLPFGWIMPTLPQLAALVGLGIFGGLAHILLTESYRYAPASLVAPFDYMRWCGRSCSATCCFGEVPTLLVYIGSGIIAAAGLFVIYRDAGSGCAARARPKARRPGRETLVMVPCVSCMMQSAEWLKSETAAWRNNINSPKHGVRTCAH